MPDSITVITPLAPADLRFESMSARDGMSQLGEMRLQLASPLPDIAANSLLGKVMSVQAVQRDGTADCRIFQDLSVPDIVKKVFADHGIADFQFTLLRSYRPWVYCVQYRESDFNFIARLLEHEGIYWYFEHGPGKHTLKLVDSQSAHDAAPGWEQLPFIARDEGTPPDIDHVFRWSAASAVKPGKVVLTPAPMTNNVAGPATSGWPTTSIRERQKILPYQTGLLPELRDAHVLEAKDGVLWSIGFKDLACFDGTTWTRVQHPDNPPITGPAAP